MQSRIFAYGHSQTLRKLAVMVDAENESYESHTVVHPYSNSPGTVEKIKLYDRHYLRTAVHTR